MRDKLIGQAAWLLFDRLDAGDENPDMLFRRIRVAVEQSWQEGMSLEGLVQSTQRKLDAPR